MHIGRTPASHLLVTLALLFPGARWAAAQCPPPPPLGVPENNYARAGALQAPPDGGARTITATRLDTGESIEVDGRLDEPVWSRTMPAGDFIQIDPNNGQPATDRTEVRILFDSDALYLGVTA